MIDRNDYDWYKDAVIYQLHIKAYFDGNNDGIGDFQGLIQKLDYIKELGVSAIWLLPFYPSPLRDDGYDISDYRGVHPSYGTMRDFRLFIREAHARGLRVITELVINHSSDQHPWFQRARLAKPGSRHRDYYVWSDTDKKYEGTRIIFCDTESSNWTWDPQANAYYWHRFYSHQPDLNFDHPQVFREVLSIMRFWLDAGVDGLRLDAVPYLVEREGTNNENLPETHALLKRIRAEIDQHYPDRMLLAEANQWPEDVQEYFGNGDECQMAFHFPLMPRMYMALAQEDRHPITDIMRQTPDIPANCQWAIFLRNHDELTLEMVTDQERDYLWNFYAADRRARINLGIRRRLAPLMEQDRRKIELLSGMLLSMPGTPVIYYGDEIGMGDNLYLGDRNGVRTPMQWSSDRNGGFSRADPSQLYLPVIMDPLYSYEAVNVENQQRSHFSLLNWTRRLISIRQQHSCFGRGVQTFLYPGNRKILAFLRECGDETILCVFNLSRAPQPMELDLSAYKGRVPIELTGGSNFPPIGDLPYLLTLTGYGFHWFLLATEAEVPRWHAQIPEPMPELSTLVVRRDVSDLIGPREGDTLLRRILPSFLPKQRWFAAKNLSIANIVVVSFADLAHENHHYPLLQVEVSFRGEQATQRYFLPLGINTKPGVLEDGALLPYVLARVRRIARVGVLHDALTEEHFALAVITAMREDRRITANNGAIQFSSTQALDAISLPAEPHAQRLHVEQSHSSTVISDVAILKIYRRLFKGSHPEVEIGRFLTEVAQYRNAPALLGMITSQPEEGEVTALGVLQQYIPNQGDGWNYTIDYLERTLDQLLLNHVDINESVQERHQVYLQRILLLGRRTAELHRAFATTTDDPEFAAEPVNPDDLALWRTEAQAQAQIAFTTLEQSLGNLPEASRNRAQSLLERREECLQVIANLLEGEVQVAKSRLHGDYHLGQVLVAADDFYLVDFEGEPAASLAQRRRKHCVLRDVAGMLRSFDYATATVLSRISQRGGDPHGTMPTHAKTWREAASAAFLAGYQETIGDSPNWPADEAQRQRLLRLFLLQKALYEVCYEANNRPQWLEIPLISVLEILDSTATVSGT